MSRYSQHLAAIWTDKVLAFHPLQNKTLSRTMGLHSGTTHGSLTTDAGQFQIKNSL